MPTPFKLEVFDKDIVYKDSTVISDTPLIEDYLTLKTTFIEIRKIDVAKGDYIHVTDFYNNMKYQGVVDKLETDEYTCSLWLKPLRSILDCIVSFDRTYLATGTLEGFISLIITSEFISNSDTLQNIPGLSVTTESSTNGAVLDLESNIGQLYNIIISALSAYGIVVSVELKPQTKAIDVVIKTANTTSVPVEADLANCIDKKFVIGDNYGAVNKLILYNQDDESETVTYYLHTDGTISTVDTNRVTPVKCRKEYLPSRDFEEKALAKATKQLAPQKYNNLIQLKYDIDDKIVRFSDMSIGTTADIYSEGEVYKSILTGYEKTEDVVLLVFGIVRVNRTDKLFLEKRSGSGAVYATAAQGAAMDSAFPDSATNGNIAVFDGTTGKKIKDSGVGILSDEFEPSIGGSTSDGSLTYTTQYGKYSRIGDVVSAWLRIHINTITTAPEGNLLIKGLPLPSANEADLRILGPVYLNGVNWGTGNTQAIAYLGNNATGFLLFGMQNNDGAYIIKGADISDNDQIFVSLTYPVK